jgi:HEAT repeat protein
MLQALTDAIAAAGQENWSSVNHHLQYLIQAAETGMATCVTASEWEQIVALALRVLEAGDFQQRWEVAKLFPKCGKCAIAPLIERLENEELAVEVRWFAGRILGEFDDPASVIALVKLLRQTEEEEVMAMASQALAHLGVTAIEALNHLLEEPSSQALAVQALAQIRRTETIEPLLKVVDSPAADIRATAVEALGSFHDDRILPVLLNALRDPAVKVRKEAAIALGLRSQLCLPPNLVEPLKPLLFDLDERVCQQAAIALGRMGTDEAAEALFPVLKSPATPIWLKLDIVRALGWIDTHQALEYLQQGLRWSDAEVCQEIVRVLGRKELPELRQCATQMLIEFLNSGQQSATQSSLKQAIALSLGELRSSEGKDALLLLANDPDRTVQLHAIAALKKFER